MLLNRVEKIMQIPQIENSLSINQRKAHNEASVSVTSIHPKINFEGKKRKDASKIAKWVGNGFYVASISSAIAAALFCAEGWGGRIGKFSSFILGEEALNPTLTGNAGVITVSAVSSVFTFLLGVICHPKGDI